MGVGNTTIATYDDLPQSLAKTKPNQTITIKVVTSQNQRRSVKVTLGEFPIPSQR